MRDAALPRSDHLHNGELAIQRILMYPVGGGTVYRDTVSPAAFTQPVRSPTQTCRLAMHERNARISAAHASFTSPSSSNVATKADPSCPAPDAPVIAFDVMTKARHHRRSYPIKGRRGHHVPLMLRYTNDVRVITILL